jgi:hypothetical protein
MHSIMTTADAIPVLLAYLDPGSGSMLFQVMAAGLVSAMVFWRSLTEWVGGFFRTGAKVK